MYQITDRPEKLTFDWLFNRVNQEDVYLRYLGFCNINEKYTNPLREDKKADCSFFWNNGTLFFKDWNWKTFTCVSVVMEVERLNYPQALEKIYELFIKKQRSSSIIISREERIKKNKERKKIEVKIQSFTKVDKKYLESFGVTSKLCKLYKCYSINHYWIDGEMKHSYSNNDPCIGYYFGKGIWKLYHYKRKEFRFVCNTSHRDLQGYDQLDWIANKLIITKSMKDVMVYRKFNLNAVAPHSESLSDWIDYIPILEKRFMGVYLNFDNDTAGVKATEKILKKFNLPYFYIEEEKDISDYYFHFGETKTKQLIERLVK